MVSPDPARRPKQVSWAYRCWTISGGLLVALGVFYVILGIIASGPVLLPVGLGVIVGAVGVAFVMLGSKAFLGDARWRSSLSALTLVVVVLLLFLSFGIPILAFALLAALVGLFGSLLAFRPESETWYSTDDPDAPSNPTHLS
ncbi:hypothetical protein GIY30_01550 [Gordonia sp. HNM0687]|uniref:Uncharacterized protein n=1 Tax=Gordonia mangrovi TaxID=2665643 RepID=A0A6L7GKN6_9ACTN|nr:hypothetical protein [Gordonia mangrovi]MDY6809004.1 hypothetical protein [Actinomycetota bacterium]MXP20053.1 hypothetical protein [Gordonia mangrovi]UVF79335.1 hypothetical protein NWF22_05700 [Gordonia mangrovi]